MLIRRIVLLVLAVGGLFTAGLARAEVKSSINYTNHIVPGPNDGRIAYMTALILQHDHYRRHAFDDEYSEKFFDAYINNYDPMHIHFTQGDLAEFGWYRTNLDDLTLTRTQEADVHPAYQIFARFMERMVQQGALVEAMLKTNKFEFTNDERILLDRKEAAFPKDLEEAKQLWAQRLRYEYLLEKIARAGVTNTTSRATNTAGVSSPKGGATATGTNLTAKAFPDEIPDVLLHRYTRTLRFLNEWDSDDVLERYLTSLAHVYDPHSDYLNQSAADNFAISMNLSLFGIGAELASEDGYCVIRKLHPGPAAKSKKIKEGDKIVAVAQGAGTPVDVVDMALNKAVQLIRGPKNSEVRLTIIPAENPGERRLISLFRDEIKLEDQAAKAKIIEVPQPGGKSLRLGVIDLPSFYATVDLSGIRGSLMAKGENAPTFRSTSLDVYRLLEKLKQERVSGVILDLRRNGGGSLEESIKLTGLFIKEGPVVQVRGPEGPPEVDEDNDTGIAYDGPLIVLTSRGSASASEIVAGALQDYGRALIVGDLSTHGKGTVQHVSALRPWVKPANPSATNDPGTLKLTIRKFYRAGGASTQLKGVLSDIVLPSIWNYEKNMGESSLENALPWDTIPSADFERLNLVAPYLAELLRRSNDRLATNKDYGYIREDIDLFRKLQADRTATLNEKQALKEKAESDARLKARTKELQARKKSDVTVYDLTLDDVGKPGLPAPEGATNAAVTAVTNAPGVASLNPDEDADEPKVPAVDATLEETEHILQDYISLIGAKAVVVKH